jgi:hypothetical protein
MRRLGLVGSEASLASSCGSTLGTALLQGPIFGLALSSAYGSLWPPNVLRSVTLMYDLHEFQWRVL